MPRLIGVIAVVAIVLVSLIWFVPEPAPSPKGETIETQPGDTRVSMQVRQMRVADYLHEHYDRRFFQGVLRQGESQDLQRVFDIHGASLENQLTDAFYLFRKFWLSKFSSAVNARVMQAFNQMQYLADPELSEGAEFHRNTGRITLSVCVTDQERGTPIESLVLLRELFRATVMADFYEINPSGLQMATELADKIGGNGWTTLSRMEWDFLNVVPVRDRLRAAEAIRLADARREVTGRETTFEALIRLSLLSFDEYAKKSQVMALAHPMKGGCSVTPSQFDSTSASVSQ